MFKTLKYEKEKFFLTGCFSSPLLSNNENFEEIVVPRLIAFLRLAKKRIVRWNFQKVKKVKERESSRKMERREREKYHFVHTKRK